MKTLCYLLCIFGIIALVNADFANDGVPSTPDILNRIITGAERSGDPLLSEATEGENTTYYLRSAEYIGECDAPFGTVHIAQLFFIRSGVRGQQTPPPRGHTFLVFYDSELQVRGFWREPGGAYRTVGSKLLLEGKVIFDYSNPTKYTAFPPGQWPHPPIWKAMKKANKSEQATPRKPSD